MASSMHLIKYASIFLILILIVWLSCISQPVFAGYYVDFLDVLPLSDSTHHYLKAHYKIGHPLCYAILAAITCLCLRNRYILSILLVFSLGAALEIVQSFLPTRAASWVDLGYNLVGVIAGAGITWGLKSLQSKAASRRDAETAERSKPIIFWESQNLKHSILWLNPRTKGFLCALCARVIEMNGREDGLRVKGGLTRRRWDWL
jgi:VanZ family protein